MQCVHAPGETGANTLSKQRNRKQSHRCISTTTTAWHHAQPVHSYLEQKTPREVSCIRFSSVEQRTARSVRTHPQLPTAQAQQYRTWGPGAARHDRLDLLHGAGAGAQALCAALRGLRTIGYTMESVMSPGEDEDYSEYFASAKH
jgi:hypothetical protein